MPLILKFSHHLSTAMCTTGIVSSITKIYFFVKQSYALTLSQTSPFLHVCSTSFENSVGKGELARYEQFLCCLHCFFYPFGELSAIFIKFEVVIYNLIQFRPSSLKYCQ